jgi:hypothetical protein
LARVLTSNGFQAGWTDQLIIPNPKRIARYDVVYGVYLHGFDRHALVAKLLGKKTVVHFVGSDAYRFARETSLPRRVYWRLILNLCDIVLYVSPHLEQLVGHKGYVLSFPIERRVFDRPSIQRIRATRDVLYYCPSGPLNEKIYRFDWIFEYARMHPNEKITIVGSKPHPAQYRIKLRNVKIIPYVEHKLMPALYRKHRRLIRMTTEDGSPVMIHEALLSGLQVTYNGREVTGVPEERDPTIFASKFREILESGRPQRSLCATIGP